MRERSEKHGLDDVRSTQKRTFNGKGQVLAHAYSITSRSRRSSRNLFEAPCIQVQIEQNWNGTATGDVTKNLTIRRSVMQSGRTIFIAAFAASTAMAVPASAETIATAMTPLN